MKTYLTIVPINPFGENKLPRTQYDRITIKCLDVSESRIEKCTLIIGGHEMFFTLGNYKAKDILAINGDASDMATYAIIPSQQIEISVQLPLPKESYRTKNLANIRLCCYLHSSKFPLEV